MLKYLAAPVITLAASLVLGSSAQAEACYRLDTYRDIIRINFVKSRDKGDKQHILAYGNWIAPGYASYPVTGAFEADTGSSGRRLSLIGPNYPGSQYASCAFSGKPGGAWEMKCAGDVYYQNYGTNLHKVSCNGLPARAPVTGVDTSNLAGPAGAE